MNNEIGKRGPSHTAWCRSAQSMERAPLARGRAAAAGGSSGRAMAEAKRVGEHAPDLVPAVRAGSPCLLTACCTNARLSRLTPVCRARALGGRVEVWQRHV